ncbi:hypothetical protein KC887_01670 [Candidatus Kaiserbacteria bacterium]|nr:hypothetical protein [Candidatus Kaiserbacteria bacterium]
MITTLIRVFVLLILISTATPALADSVVRSGETVSIASDQVVAGDFYSLASVSNISGRIEQDLVAAGGKVTLNGTVDHDALIVAGSADVHGAVAEDVRIIAGETVIAEPVAGNVLVISGRVEILSTASIGGDLLVFGGDVTVEGSVGGDVVGHVGQVRIDAPVAGDITVSTNQLTLGDRANVAGNVTYTSDQVFVRAQNAVIEGEVLRNDPVIAVDNTSSYRSIALPVLALLFSALVWFLLSRHTLLQVTSHALRVPPRALLIGIVTLIGMPIVAFILLASVIGVHVGIILLLLYAALLLLGVVSTISLSGLLVMRGFKKSTNHVHVLTLLTGTVVVCLLLFLPIIGPFMLFGLFLLGVGAIADCVFKRIRH